MSKGTILYIGGFELPDKNAAAHRVLSNAKIFRELGYSVVFIDVDKTLDSKREISTTLKTIQGFDCWSVSYPNRMREWIDHLTTIEHILTVSETYFNIVAIVAYNYPSIALHKLNKYGKKYGVKIIADCTEWYSTKGSSFLYKLIKGFDSLYRMRFVQKKIDGLIVISSYLENYYRDVKNIVKIPPLVDINEEKWYLENTEYIERVDNSLYLVYSGSPGRYKDNLVNIVDALYELDELDNYKLIIVGISKNNFIETFPDYEDKINRLHSKIVFLGRLSHIESLKIIKSSDYSIIIRDKSRLTMAGFPTKFTESVSCQTPVITTLSSDIKDYMIDESNGLVIEDSTVKSLKKVLSTCLMDNANIHHKRNMINVRIFHYQNFTEVMNEMVSNVIK